MHPVFKVFRIPRDGLDNISFLVLVGLANYLNDKTGECYPSVPKLARFTLLARSTVQLALKRLVDIGRLEVKQGGGRRTNYYILHLGDPIEVTRPNLGLQPPDIRASGAWDSGCSRPEDRPDSLIGSPVFILSVDPLQTENQLDQLEGCTDRDTDKTDKTGRQRQQQPRYGENPEPPQRVSRYDEDADESVWYWECFSDKPVFKQDFVEMLEGGIHPADIIINLHWMFTISRQWASESPVWSGGFDIRRSSAFKTNFKKIDQSCLNWYSRTRTLPEYWKVMGDAEASAVQRELERRLANPREPDPQDVAEEELMLYYDEYETEGDFNPFAEDDEREWKEGRAIVDFNPFADNDARAAQESQETIESSSLDNQSPSNPTPDCAVAPTAILLEEISDDDDEEF